MARENPSHLTVPREATAVVACGPSHRLSRWHEGAEWPVRDPCQISAVVCVVIPSVVEWSMLSMMRARMGSWLQAVEGSELGFLLMRQGLSRCRVEMA